jgi:flagellar basal-body rod protein FlgB
MIPDDQFRILSRLMDVAVLRGQVHAGNLANQNTPGYRAQAVSFDEAFQTALAEDGNDAALAVAPTVFEPRSTSMKVDGNDVSTEREVAALAQNKLLYDTYIAIYRGRRSIMQTAITPAP